MPVVYRFRVTFEDYDEISRDIEIKSTQSFLELHHTIQSSIGFDGQKAASFYMSNDHWIKGQEIASAPRTDKDGNTAKLMESARLCDFIADPHQKILYLSDYQANWNFMIELVKIVPQADPMRNYPVCVKSAGEAPKQYLTVPSPKTIAAEDEEFDKLLDLEEDEAEADDQPEKEDILGETEVGVEMEEIEGMSEEGEEEEAGEEGEEEVDYNDAEEDQREDY